MTVTSDDVPGLRVSAAAVTVAEDDDGATPRDERTAVWTVRLAAEPTGPVTVTPASDDLDAATVAPPALTFTAADWETPRTVTVTAVADDALGDRAATVVHTAAGGGYPDFANSAYLEMITH